MSDSPTAPRRLPALAYALAALLVLVIGGLVAWFGFLRTAEQAPRVAAEQARELVADLGELARAFQEHTVTRRFISHGTSVEGSSRLQVATLEQTEVFELEDEASAFWGALDLPAVKVRATAPVTTTYYVDFEQPWRFELEGRRVLVTAPRLTPNTPAIDASEIRYEVREGSLLRDESVVLEQLKRELTTRAALRAEDNAALVRDTARVRIESFVRAWFLQSFGDGGEYNVEIRFEDEDEDDAPPAAPEMR
ncbi:MAG: DUF4230 domain-containing protein [Deltaproteobacteria bacterium]|nr:DUF4230 domain-containing protein [Deltaproteobacteria bacterium]